MFRSEIESLRSPSVDFWSGKTVHFERIVGAAPEQAFSIVINLHVM